MKKELAVIVLGLSILFSPVLYQGCAKNPQAVIVAAEGATVKSVDQGMQAWRDWVVAGRATQQQVDAVKVAYNQYYGAQLGAKAALELWVSSNTPESQDAATKARQSAIVAEGALISLLTDYLSKKL